MKETSTIRPASAHQLGHLGDAADVLHPVGIGEAEVAVEAVADIVAVEHDRCAWPSACSFFSTRLAMVDLPEPDRPVNHRTAGFWPFSAARACLFDVQRLPVDVGARRSENAIMPAPTVALVKRSIRMKPPVSRLSR
jgi:hypothetical protein